MSKLGLITVRKTKRRLCFLSRISVKEVEAELLGIPLSTPMMMIREIVYSNTDEPLHRTKQYLLGDRFKYVIPKK